MIKTLLFPLSRGLAQLEVALNALADQGFIPLTAEWIPTENGPGGILYTLGQINDAAAASAEPIEPSPSQEVPAVGGNGHNGVTHHLPSGEIIDPAAPS